ncbi:MAG: orotate phosphoribosyltransferase-like protein [Candidatus Thermoplasmatota archaeon]
MKGIEKLVDKAKRLKDRGLMEKEIADELNVSPDTVTWLLTRDIEEKQPPIDVKIGWRSIGVYGRRIGLLASLFSDIILEEMENMDADVDTVVGLAVNGIPAAVLVSEQLDRELAIYRPPTENRGQGGGTLASNYAGVEGKNIVIVDDVINTGETMKGAVKDLEEEGANVKLCTVTVNKNGRDDVLGVPLRALIRARLIG